MSPTVLSAKTCGLPNPLAAIRTAGCLFPSISERTSIGAESGPAMRAGARRTFQLVPDFVTVATRCSGTFRRRSDFSAASVCSICSTIPSPANRRLPSARRARPSNKIQYCSPRLNTAAATSLRQLNLISRAAPIRLVSMVTKGAPLNFFAFRRRSRAARIFRRRAFFLLSDSGCLPAAFFAVPSSWAPEGFFDACPDLWPAFPGAPCPSAACLFSRLFSGAIISSATFDPSRK